MTQDRMSRARRYLGIMPFASRQGSLSLKGWTVAEMRTGRGPKHASSRSKPQLRRNRRLPVWHQRLKGCGEKEKGPDLEGPDAGTAVPVMVHHGYLHTSRAQVSPSCRPTPRVWGGGGVEGGLKSRPPTSGSAQCQAAPYGGGC